MKRKHALLKEDIAVAERRAKRALEVLGSKGEEAAKAILAHLSTQQISHVVANFSGLRELC